MTYCEVNINVKELKETLKDMFSTGTPQQKKDLWLNISAIRENISIDDGAWDEIVDYIEEELYSMVFNKMNAHRVTPRKTCKQVNAKKMVGNIPNFKKNMKRIL